MTFDAALYWDHLDPVRLIYGLVWSYLLTVLDHVDETAFVAIYNYGLEIPSLKSRLIITIVNFRIIVCAIIILRLLRLYRMHQML